MANKKVSQLTSKPSVLTTDLFPIADPSTGQLFKTTISDLGTAIGSGVSSVNTLVGAVVLDTDDIQELVSPTNKWFTDTRARAAISGGTGISYNSGTGVITNAVTSGQIATALGYTPANGANYLPLAGGTMGGAIFGTIATFESSSSVTALGITLSGSSGDGIKITHSAGRAFNIQSSGSGYGLIINNETASTSIPFVIQKAGANKITFTDAGGATYSDRINTPTLYATGSSSEAAVTIYQNSGYHALSITQAGVGAAIYADGKIFANQFIRIGGASTSFLKADGSVDTNTYLTTSSASSTYLPLAGGTLTGALSGTTATFSGLITGGQLKTGVSTYGIWEIGSDSNYDGFYIYKGGGTYAFGINKTSYAATFSSSVTATSLKLNTSVSTGSNFIVAGYADFYNSTNTLLRIQHDGSRGTIETFTGGGYGVTAINPSGGNVGIGTTAPYALLSVYGGSAGDRILIDSNSSSGSNGAIAWGAGSVPNISARIKGTDDGAYGTHLIFETRGNGTFGTTTTERMRITSSGDCNLAYGGTFIAYTQTSGTYGMIIQNLSNNTSATAMLFRGWNGSTTGSINTYVNLTTYNTSSDYRLKEDLKQFSGLDLVSKLNMYDFKWKEADWRMYGGLAHEIQEVLPYAVTGVKDGKDTQGVDYSTIVPLLIQSIKELKSKLDDLKA